MIPSSSPGDINPKKPGKVRRVCDATAKFQGSSLNSHLLSGPDLLNNLVGIFMRFREEKVTFSRDIEVMFNQVAVPEADQVALRFLLHQSPKSAIEVYQFMWHIFGAKCAPTCSNYALLRSAEDNKMEFPIATLAVITQIPELERAPSVKVVDENVIMPVERALGVIWDTNPDCFV